MGRYDVGIILAALVFAARASNFIEYRTDESEAIIRGMLWN